MRAM